MDKVRKASESLVVRVYILRGVGLFSPSGVGLPDPYYNVYINGQPPGCLPTLFSRPQHNPGFQTVIVPGSPGYVIYPSEQVAK